jgi:DNA-binding transcriptional regulator YiaG
MSYNILDHFNVEEYEKEKDKAILSIGKKMKNDVKELKRKLGSLKFPIPTQIEFAKRLEVSITTLKSWKEDSMDKKIEENQLKSQKATLLSISTEDGED